MTFELLYPVRDASVETQWNVFERRVRRHLQYYVQWHLYYHVRRHLQCRRLKQSNFKFDQEEGRQYNCRPTNRIAAQQIELPLNQDNCRPTNTIAETSAHTQFFTLNCIDKLKFLELLFLFFIPRRRLSKKNRYLCGR